MHLDHVRILAAALRDFKNYRVENNLSWVKSLNFRHESYDMLCRCYGIPRDVCTASKLMDNAMADSSVLLRKRRAPLNQYYSMLTVDTPGYVPSPDWAKTMKPIDKANPKSWKHRPLKDRTAATHIKPPAGNDKTAVYKTPGYNDRVYNASQDGSTSANPSGLQNLGKSTSAYLDTDKISDKRFSNMQRNLKRDKRGPNLVGDSNGEGRSCSGNENEERDNALYDDRMAEADKKNLKDWMYQIKRIKQNDLPLHFTKQREQDLDNAQVDFVDSKKVPVYLEGVKPPWNRGTGQAFIRYNEMVVRKLERRIEKARERNAALCALEDAAKRTDGPSGRGKR